MPDVKALEGRLRDHMVAAGMKNTRQRQVIFETFLGVTTHVSLDELLGLVQKTMPGVGYATVYRTMKLFSDAGVALERNFGDGQTRYEAAGLGADHHDHLICRLCGHIFEFEDAEIERRQAAVAKEHGLRIVSHRLDIWGECLEPSACEWRKAEKSGGAQ
jgi:Fur family transcriptional regulator, ferric uptake regulator